MPWKSLYAVPEPGNGEEFLSSNSQDVVAVMTEMTDQPMELDIVMEHDELPEAVECTMVLPDAPVIAATDATTFTHAQL